MKNTTQALVARLKKSDKRTKILCLITAGCILSLIVLQMGYLFGKAFYHFTHN